MRILYPSDPLQPRHVDEAYEEEFEAVGRVGIERSLFSLEEFEMGRFRPTPALVTGQTVVYRGWMLPLDVYARLTAAITANGARPLTSPAQYRLCHHLPNWYPLLVEFTAPTRILTEDADFEAVLGDLHWSGYFVKDYVKSLNTAGGSLVDRPADIDVVVAKLRQFRGAIEGGVCVRQRQEFVPGSEQRCFVWQGRAFVVDGDPPAPLAACLERIDSPFYSVDIAQLQTGDTVIVELGDGQVSDRKNWPADHFAKILATG